MALGQNQTQDTLVGGEWSLSKLYFHYFFFLYFFGTLQCSGKLG